MSPLVTSRPNMRSGNVTGGERSCVKCINTMTLVLRQKRHGIQLIHQIVGSPRRALILAVLPCPALYRLAMCLGDPTSINLVHMVWSGSSSSSLGSGSLSRSLSWSGTWAEPSWHWSRVVFTSPHRLGISRPTQKCRNVASRLDFL